MAAGVGVSLLGPVEVHTDGETVPIAGVRLQSLLSLLALAVPHGVSDDRLVDELWGDDPPAKPANALQALVSHLRRIVGRDTLVRHGNGYALRVEPDAIDALRLERLVQDGRRETDRGDHGRASGAFRAAIALVRGTPFAELVDQWFAREAAARLDELVLAAQEGLVDGELAMGRHADVLTTVVDLVASHPVRERFRAQLIVALYRCGRQVDALQAYREARDYLLEELGLDPGPELRQLERSVLAHDPTLAAPIALSSPVANRPDLPAPLTSFVGRQAELAALEPAVGTSRLVSLVGPAGVGKTRLVVELAQRLADRQEVWFVELAPVTPGASVAEAVAGGIGAPDRDGVSAPPVQRTVERLGDRPAVLVLDNCEHVLDDVARFVLGALAGCPGLRVVTTTREPLGVEGERQVAVTPLGTEDAIALFVARARDAQPLFDAGAAEPQLRPLIDHLDGLPLAIELAAARTKALPVPEIVERLGNRFQLLRRTTRGGTSRHEGLEAAIDWSYELLFAGEQETFQRLAVFSGGATSDAVERMCGPEGLDLASRLVDRSLLVADTSGPAVRFTMLESLRAYGCERLRAAGRLEEVRSEHVAWCADLAARASAEATGPDQLAWLDRLDTEHDNIQAALGHAVEHDVESAVRLAGALILPWWFRGRRQEIRQWAATVLDAAGDQFPLLRAKVLATAGLMAEPRHRGGEGPAGTELHDELVTAEAAHRQAIDLYREHGANPVDLAYAELLLLATLARQASMGETIAAAEAATLVTSVCAVFDAAGDDYGSAVTRTTDAILAIAEGDLPRATADVDAAAPFARRLGERFSSSRLAYVRGMLDDLAGNPRSAYRHIEHGLRLMSELGLHQGVTSQARMLAALAERCGEPVLAAQWRAFVEDRGGGWTHYDGTVMAAAQNHAGLDARAAGDLDRAARAHLAALDWYRRAELSGGVAVSEVCLGFVSAAAGDAIGAASHHTAALDAAQVEEDPVALAVTLVGVAAGAAEGDPVRAARLLGAADAVRSEHPLTPPGIERDAAAVTAAVRERLGGDAFDAELAAGARLDRRAAIVLATG